MALISLQDVSLGFGGPLLLEAVNLQIERGEITADEAAEDRIAAGMKTKGELVAFARKCWDQANAAVDAQRQPIALLVHSVDDFLETGFAK